MTTFSIAFSAEAERFTLDITKYDWGMWRDCNAGWIDVDIYLPPVEVAGLPVNPPTCGWDDLPRHIEKTVSLPATVEEHFWGDNGNIEGVAGDYRGVSWWTTAVELGPEIRGKQVFLDFESVHLRAEVFVNRKLVGYDVIGHTPFSADITGAVITGKNEIAVRITDPCGNFNWNDRAVLKWGRHDIPAVHGFGGITGRVILRAVDPVHIDDIYVLNKPAVTEADAVVTLVNGTDAPINGTMTVTVHPWKQNGDIVWKKSFKRKLNTGSTQETVSIKMKNVKIWSLDDPNLYIVKASFAAEDGSMSDSMERRFGFRWFDIGEKNGSDDLYLNGKRIVLRGAMSWCFWPVNGVYPTRDMAEKDVRTAKALGLTYMNFHRAIGQPLLMDVADEQGFLTYEEPGGYSCEGADPNDDLWRRWRREKLLRMVKRDRSHPSLIIYNLQNRTPNPLTDEDRDNMRAAHELDPSRILTFISGFWKEPPKESPDKLFFRPYDMTEYYTGWFDMHNHTAEYGYADGFYNGPEDYLRYTGIKDEVVFWGEDGGLYGPPRLQLIKEFHDRHGGTDGWMAKRFISWFDAWDAFLDRNNFRRFFPDVDAFTTALGNATLHYHGRIIENIRAGNLDDCYTINGWAAPHMVNQSEVADLYRNSCGEPAVMARYCRPIYIAVKLSDRVAPIGSTLAADFYLIDETGLSGRHTLSIKAVHENGETLFEKSETVNIRKTGEYGRLLLENIGIPIGNTQGYVTVSASLTDGRGNEKADGSDEAFAVDVSGNGIPSDGAVLDSSGEINRFLERVCGFTLTEWNEETAAAQYIIIGDHEFRNAAEVAPVLDQAANGATVIVLENAGSFAAFLTSENNEAADFRGVLRISKGNLVAGSHDILNGLPQNKAFDWEYQTFYTGKGFTRLSLNLYGVDTIIAAVTDNEREVGTALTVIPYGRGRIVLSTLTILPLLADDSLQASVAHRLFLNMIRYAGNK